MEPGPSHNPTVSTALAYSPTHRETLLNVARASISHGLAHGRPAELDLDAFDAPLRETRATFVTLHLEGSLRGCIGTLEAIRPLVVDVAHSAFSAAFRDPRFGPVSQPEVSRLDVHISILSPPEVLRFDSEDNLLAKLRPKIDGLILEERGNFMVPKTYRGTFLPAVWDSIAAPRDFLNQLKLKSGLPVNYWSPTVRIWRYTAESVP